MEHWRVVMDCREGWGQGAHCWLGRWLPTTWTMHPTEAEARAECSRIAREQRGNQSIRRVYVVSPEEYQVKDMSIYTQA